MLCGSLADMDGGPSSLPPTPADPPLQRLPTRSSSLRRTSKPSSPAAPESRTSPAFSPRESLPPRSPAPRSSHQTSGREVVIVPLRRRSSVDVPRLRESRQANTPTTASFARAKRSTSVPRKARREGSVTGDETDAERALGVGDLDMLSSDFGYSTASLASRAPTFVSTHSAFTDESSLQTDGAASRSQPDLSESYRAFRPSSSQPVPIRPPFSRRRSSTGSLYDTASSPARPSVALVSSSVPSPRRIGPPTLAQSAPFSNLVSVEDIKPSKSRRSASSRRPSFGESPLPPALHTTISITDGQPARKLQRKASLTVRGKHGGGGPATPRADLPSPRPPPPAKYDSAPAALPRPSISSRPSLTTSRSFSAPSSALPDFLPVHLAPLSPPSSTARRSRSKTKTAADTESSPPQRAGSVSKSGTLRGSLVKLKKSTASLRSAFRSSRHDDMPSSPPPPLPPTPALPVLTPRSATAQTTSTGALVAALERTEKKEEATLKRRASSRAEFAARSRGESRDGRGGDESLEGFSYAATSSRSLPSSARLPPSPSSPFSPPAPPSPYASQTHRRCRSRPRPRTATIVSGQGPITTDDESSPRLASRLRRVASTGAVKPRRPPPPMPALVARLERHCAKAEAAV